MVSSSAPKILRMVQSRRKMRVKNPRRKGRMVAKGRKMQRPMDCKVNLKAPGATLKTTSAGRIVVHNRELVLTATDTIPSGASVGTGTSTNALFNADTLGASSWLGKLLPLYDKYRILRASLEYVPAVPFTSIGQAAMYWDNDPNDAKPEKGAISAVSGSLNVTVSHVSQQMHQTLLSTQLQRLPWYLTKSSGADVSEATAGQVVLVTTPVSIASNATASTSVTVGTVWLDYTIELSDPTR